MKTFEKKLLSVSVLSILLSATAHAQSVDVGVVSVQGQALGGGLMVQEDTPKARSVVTSEALSNNPSAGNALDKIAKVPGLQMSSTDSSGISGLNYTMRGMGADQIGLSADGIPLNDSGNYAVYPNLLGDSENISQVFVTQGSAEVDGPHIGSSGGNIGLSTKRPDKNAGLFVEQKFGSNDLKKTFARIETGQIGNFSAWLSASHTEANKWKGQGDLEGNKVEANAFYKADNGNTSSLIVKYNKQDNYGYATITKAAYDAAPDATGSNGHKADFPADRYQNARNPFENLNVSFTQDLILSDSFKATIQPYYYWGNGGGSNGTSNLSKSSSKSGIYDLSNLSATTAFYRPSMTQTWRPGVTVKAKWDINDQHSLSTGYWYERARQRQTQPYITTSTTSGPADTWAESNQFIDAKGQVVQGRNQFTITPAQRVWLQDAWYVSPKVTLLGGLAWESVERKGNNLGSLSAKAETKQAKYNELLPNFSAKYQLNDQNQFFYNLSKNMRAPQNYVLYNVGDSINLKPELSLNQELGWRYQTQDMLLSATAYNMHYKNRQISSQDPSGDYVMVNAGKVDSRGVELEWSGNLPYNMNYYTSYSYTDSKQKGNALNKGVYLPTVGKQTPNTSKNVFSAGIGYDNRTWSWNFSGNYTGPFYGDLTNDEKIAGRTTFDFSAGVHVPVKGNFVKDVTLSFGVNNMFDKEYLASAKTVQINSKTVGTATGSAPLYNIGEERTFVISLSAKL
ncbi:TonB-dependent receptor family protein [Acinetobacter rathckeae]|uniref:TonB-dependent receptor family protein n=1 Tax=Acinetobacter rathckeae TaxID=2605272 RepID=UPI0018A2A15B|nr:TonB-dependent receptor [Acinetobacter rathckeae]MBF7688918.1 TonB-dependent receptor [Acinetobacter rathckeae]MBF7696317.1 TonB-dependent receptor [Acinetobacter rathckeae]